MKTALFLVFTLNSFVSFLLDSVFSATVPPPPCITSSTQFGYVNGSLSSTETFVNCLKYIPDAAIFPSYYNNKINYVVPFSVGITLSNLIQVSLLVFLSLRWFLIFISTIIDR